MLKKFIAKTTLNPHKYQLEFILNKLELSIENPSCTILITLQIGNQKLETLQKLKAEQQILIDEKMTLITSFYEDSKHNYQEKQCQFNVYLSNGKTNSLIGFAKFDISQFARQANKGNYESMEIFQLEKSPDFEGRLYVTIRANFTEIEPSSGSLINKIKKTALEVPKSENGGSQYNPKRSLTPTPKSSNANRSVQSMMPERSKSKDIVNKLQKAANTVTLAKRTLNSVGVGIKKSHSKSPAPKKEMFKAINIPGPVLGNRFMNAFEEKMKMFREIDNLKEEKNIFTSIIQNSLKNTKDKEKEIDKEMNLLKELEIENYRLKKEIENVKNEFIRNEIQIKQKENNIIVSNNEKEEIINLNSKIEEIKNDYEKSISDNETIKKNLILIKSKNEITTKETNELKKKIEKIDEEIIEMNKKQFDLKNDFVNMKEKKQITSEKINELFGEEGKKMKELSLILMMTSKEIEKTKQEIELNDSEYKKINFSFEEMQISFDDKKKEIKNLEENIKKLENEKNQLEKNINEIKNSFESIKENIELNKENYNKTNNDLGFMMHLIIEKGGADLIEGMNNIIGSK